MQAVILAAGKGTRLYPLTKNLPKVMIDICGQPLLEHHIDLLRSYEIKDIFINLFTLSEKISRYFRNGKKWGVTIKYAKELNLLGSAGALHNFKHMLKKDFFILYGDVYMEIDFMKILKYHRENHSLLTLVIHESSHPKDSDLIEVDHKGKVVNWLKTPHSRDRGFSNAGLYIMNSDVLKLLPKRVPSDLAHDFIPYLLSKITIYAYKTEEFMMDIGTLDRYNYVLKKLSKIKNKGKHP